MEEEKEKESFMKDARSPQAKKTPQAKKATFLVLLKQRRFPKLRRSTLLVVVPQGEKPLVMTLRERLTLVILYLLIIMGMSMLNLLVLEICLLLVLFGFLRPLLLTKEDTL